MSVGYSLETCLLLFERYGITFEINDGKIVSILPPKSVSDY